MVAIPKQTMLLDDPQKSKTVFFRNGNPWIDYPWLISKRATAFRLSSARENSHRRTSNCARNGSHKHCPVSLPLKIAELWRESEKNKARHPRWPSGCRRFETSSRYRPPRVSRIVRGWLHFVLGGSCRSCPWIWCRIREATAWARSSQIEPPTMSSESDSPCSDLSERTRTRIAREGIHRYRRPKSSHSFRFPVSENKLPSNVHYTKSRTNSIATCNIHNWIRNFLFGSKPQNRLAIMLGIFSIAGIE